MKLLIIRHGDPDYSVDSLTKKGWREAELLSDRLTGMGICAFYVSPLGRARDTAAATLKKTGQTAETLPWLREFDAPVVDKATGKKHLPWDWPPAFWTRQPEFYDKDRWHATPMMWAGHVGEEAEHVYAGLDGLIEKHGYRREGQIYRAVRPNTDTVALFCHFGVECVLLGHLLGISPMVLWHGCCAAPTSVTTLVTEERRKGVAFFRMNAFGDTSHLFAAKETPAFAGRFCETYDNMDERHD